MTSNTEQDLQLDTTPGRRTLHPVVACIDQVGGTPTDWMLFSSMALT